MSFPRYPDYKETSATDLAYIPSHWDLKKLKRLVTRSNAGEVIDKSHWGESEHRELLYTCALEPLASDFPGFPTEKRTTEQDLLLTRNGTPYVHKPLANSIYSNVVQRVTLNGDVDRDFMAVATQHAARSLKGYGVSIESLNYEMWKELPICVAPLNEQVAIASFLDRETAKIDALVAAQEQLITLLKEKRQAVISHAVTKGLDPSVPMKDSGVEWLGEVPAHWEIKKVSLVFRARKGSNAAALTKEYCATIEGEYPVYSGQTENAGVMASISSYEFDAHEAGVLFSTTVGAKAMTIMHIFGKFSLSQNCMIIAPIVALHVRFFFYHMQPLFQYERGLIPEHMQASFRMEDLYAYRIATPNFDEQISIAKFLDERCAAFDALIDEAEINVSLLKERRSSIISAAVTGQIDVRGLAPAQERAA